MRSAEGEQALQALLKCIHDRADTLEAPEAEPGIFTRLLPIGLAAMQRSCAPRGTGERGPAITRADGERRPRQKRLRGRDDVALFGQCTVARPCDRTAWGARDLPAGRTGSPARAVLLVRPASRDDRVRRRAPRHSEGRLLGATLCSRGRRERVDGGGASSPAGR